MRFVRTLAASAAAMALALPAFAHDVVYVATLTGAAEAPPNASGGLGAVVVTFNDDTFMMRVQTTFAGLIGNVTASHIHCCTAVAGTGTAGVATQVPTFPGFPLGNTFGSYDQTFNLSLASSWNPAYITANGGTVANAFAAFSTGLNAGKAYFNIHTTFAPGGEIRGFLTAAPVPEPESYALMLAGLAVVGGIAARRRAAA